MKNLQYGWTIATLSFLALFASMGVRASFGAYVIPWEKDFGASRGEVSLISLIGFIVFGLGMPIGGRLADRFGTRKVLVISIAVSGVGVALSSYATSLWQMIVLYGFVASVGFAGTSPVTLSAGVVKWFTGRRGLVLGITNSGIAVGQMALVPLSIYLIDDIGWRHTLLAFGLAYVGVLAPIFWFLYRDKPGEVSQLSAPKATAARGGETWGIVMSLTAWLIIVPYFVCGVTDIGLYNTHFIPLAEGRNFASDAIVTAVTLNGVATLAGSLMTGYLTDTMSLTKLLGYTYALRGASIVLLYFSYRSEMLVASSVLLGLTTVATIAPTTALCARVYGAHRVGSMFGMMSLFHQFGAAAGSYIPGLMFDVYGNYNVALILSASMLGLGAVMTWVMRPRPVGAPTALPSL